MRSMMRSWPAGVRPAWPISSEPPRRLPPRFNSSKIPCRTSRISTLPMPSPNSFPMCVRWIGKNARADCHENGPGPQSLRSVAASKLFTFLKRPGIPPTNNHAERALRGPVISRKISFGSRPEAGAHAFAVLASLLGTARRQNQPVLKFLHTLFTSDIDAAQAALYKNTA